MMKNYVLVDYENNKYFVCANNLYEAIQFVCVEYEIEESSLTCWEFEGKEYMLP